MISAIAGLLMLLTLDQKIETGLRMCDELSNSFDYDGCVVQVSADESVMWLHGLCFVWDPVRERGHYDEHVIVKYAWDGDRVKATEIPYLLGCPEYS